jgi:anhydro-N-acetylmuramic acid kinase
MTGTSMDGLDAALVRIEGEGLDITPTFVRGISEPLGSLARLLRPVAEQKPHPAGKLRSYARMLGMRHTIGLRKLLGDEAGAVDLIVVHGQTIFHEPHMSLQLMDPWVLAREFRRPVMFDLRGADVACGGTGAPITPIADHVLFRDAKETRAVVNLGGFINFTWLPPSRRGRGDAAALRSIRAGDVCSCNNLLDAIARLCFKKPYDADGARAMGGTVDAKALDMLQMMLDAGAEHGQSLGTGDEAIDWVKMHRTRGNGADLARTACHAIARTVARHIGEAARVLVAGGGIHNAALMHELREAIPHPVQTTDDHGVPTQFREAIGMAILGSLSQDRVPITLPQVTGCSEPIIAGAWIHP